MADYRRSAHAVTDVKYPVIWVTKYRYKILRGDVAERARDLLRQICVAREVTIIRGAVSPDHIHMLGAAAVGALETGAIPEGAVVAAAPTGVSRAAEAVLGAASVGAWLLLRECGDGRREDDSRVYRESAVGRGCGRLQDCGADRALSRRGSRVASRRLQPRRDFQSTRNLPALAGSR